MMGYGEVGGFCGGQVRRMGQHRTQLLVLAWSQFVPLTTYLTMTKMLYIINYFFPKTLSFPKPSQMINPTKFDEPTL